MKRMRHEKKEVLKSKAALLKKLWAFLLILVLFFPSFERTTYAKETDWTVLVYLCGTDLETGGGFASINLEEIIEANASDKVNVVIQTGGTNEWQLDINPNVIERYALEDNDLYLVDEVPLASMGEASTFGDFLSWGVENFPADKYMLVLWNHGGGSVRGVAFDEKFGFDSLSLNELAEGLSMAEVEFEIIGFDACLMASLETAAAIAPYGRYMVASQELEPGSGWDYTKFLNYMVKSPTANGEAVGKAICDSYYQKCALEDNESFATLSVVDLKKIPALVQAFDKMGSQMTDYASDISFVKPFTRAVQRSENYGGNNSTEGYTNMVDLGDIVLNAEDVLPETASDVLDALFDAVLYKTDPENRSKANGLSLYYPLSKDKEELTQYAYVAVSDSYLRYFEGVFDWTIPKDVSISTPAVEGISKEDYQVEFETYITDDGYFTLDITEGFEAVDSVLFNIYYYDEEYDEFLYLGMDNDITGDWETGLFYDNFRGVWPTINDSYCSLILVAEEDDYNIYTVPVKLNGEVTNLRCTYVFNEDEDEEGYFKVLGAWDGIDPETGMSAKEIRKLRKGDEISFLFEAFDSSTEEEYTYEMDEFVYDGTILMKESELFDGQYYYMYEITDIFGNKYYSDYVIMECEDGKIFVFEDEEE